MTIYAGVLQEFDRRDDWCNTHCFVGTKDDIINQAKQHINKRLTEIGNHYKSFVSYPIETLSEDDCSYDNFIYGANYRTALSITRDADGVHRTDDDIIIYFDLEIRKIEENAAVKEEKEK